MDETGEPVRYFDQNLMTASGLDTLASASAESELAHSGNGEADSFNQPKGRRTSDPDEYSKLSSSPLSNDDDIERRAIMSEAFGTEFVRPGTLPDYNPTTSALEQRPLTTMQPVGKVPSAKSIAKPKTAGKVATKAATAKPKTASAPSSSTLKRKKPANDSDSSDSEQQQSPRIISPSDAQPIPSNTSTEPQAEDVVIPQRALTVRERHRECNRLVARKTRVKKKIELDLLQSSFNDFRNFNDTLRSMLKAVVTREISSRILLDCNFQLPNNVVAIVAEMIAARECQQYITNCKVETLNRSFCITNPTVFDNPIAYASQDFGELTGFLQGAESDAREIYRLKIAVERGMPEEVVIKNYRRDGSAFWNLIHIMPVSDVYGKVVLVVGCHTEVFQIFSPNGDEMFWTKAQSDIPSIPLLDPSDILPTLLTSPSNEASQAQLQLQPHLHVHTLSDPPSFSNDSLSIVKSLVGTLDDDYLDLKSGNDKGNLQIPSPEAMFRSWDSYGSYPSSGDTSTHGISISNINGNSNNSNNGNSGNNVSGNGIVNGGSNGMNNNNTTTTHTHCTNTISNSTYTNNNNNNNNTLNGSHNNLNNNNNNTGTINVNINNSKQPSIEKSVIYESIHDKSVLRNSVVWDPWKYGNGEPQRPYQLP